MSSLPVLIRNKTLYELDKVNKRIHRAFNEGFIKKVMTKPIVETMDETMDKLINGASISRYGDGEIDIICGRTQGFQKKDRDLAKRLKYILNQNGKHEDFLVGIPYMFEDLNIFIDSAAYHWQIRLDKERYKWYMLLNRKQPYSNSQITRFYFDWRDKRNCKGWADKLKMIWDKKDIIIVEGDKSRLGVGNDLFRNARSIERILCPSENAFDSYDKILECTSRQDKNKLMIIALGPTASILAYDLYLKGFQAIDIGHIDIEYEWMLSGAVEKTAVKGKYVNEVDGGNVVEDINDVKYLSEIIERVE